jgi:F420-dependent oxidoreductase-like protein
MTDQLPLRTSVGAGVRLGNSTTLDGLLDEVRGAEADGFDRVSLAHDPWSQDAGVGTPHKFVIEDFYGLSFAKPATHTRDYLSTLLPLLADHALPKGQSRPMEVRFSVPGAGSPPVYLAALGPKMLNIAGELTSGTITWLTPASVIRDHIRPVMDGAASGAGKPRPEVICGLPVCITDDAADARARIAKHFKEYEYAPSYRATMDRAGAAGPADVALVGTEKEVSARSRSWRRPGRTNCSPSSSATSPNGPAPGRCYSASPHLAPDGAGLRRPRTRRAESADSARRGPGLREPARHRHPVGRWLTGCSPVAQRYWTA